MQNLHNQNYEITSKIILEVPKIIWDTFDVLKLFLIRVTIEIKDLVFFR